MARVIRTVLFDSRLVACIAAAYFTKNSGTAEKDSGSSSSSPTEQSGEGKVRNDAPRTTAAGFDPEALERGAKALREINASVHAKKVFDLMKLQEETRQKEETARRAEFQALQAQHETERQRVMYEEQKKLAQQQAQAKAQLARYEDELARKRMQAEHEGTRVRNAELVKMQEESSVRQEQVKRITEEKVQAERRQTDMERAERDRETIRVKVMAEAEGRAHEAKLTEDVKRRLLIESAGLEKDKILGAINASFAHIGGGIKILLTEQDKLVMVVGGLTALAAGIYATREGARVLWGYVDRMLGQPSLIRESSRGRFPWSRRKVLAADSTGLQALSNFVSSKSVILHPALKLRIQQFGVSIINTKKNRAPFRNILFFGPPGTGKTMVAKLLAKLSGLDYALMTGGDVAPLGPKAVTKIHQLFDWAGNSRGGLLLFIDEADAFLSKRNNTHMSEAQRSALNAFLYRTGDQSQDVVLVLATNRPGDLDLAIMDRIDEAVEFPVPGLEERIQLLKLYFSKYVAEVERQPQWKWWTRLKTFIRKNEEKKVEMNQISDDVIYLAANRTEGFSGREIAKLMASVQGAVNAAENPVLDPHLFLMVVEAKVLEHQQRLNLAAS